MARKVLWTPKVLTLKDKNLSRWCDLGQHIWIPFKTYPKSKMCKYCRKEELVNTLTLQEDNSCSEL